MLFHREAAHTSALHIQQLILDCVRNTQTHTLAKKYMHAQSITKESESQRGNGMARTQTPLLQSHTHIHKSYDGERSTSSCDDLTLRRGDRAKAKALNMSAEPSPSARMSGSHDSHTLLHIHTHSHALCMHFTFSMCACVSV